MVIEDPDSRLSESVIDASRALSRIGLNRGTSGNLSVRSQNGCLITPSGVPSEMLLVDSIVEIDLDGALLNGSVKPSSEWPFHTAIYRTRPDVKAIVHTHSTHASSLSGLNIDVPSFHYMVAVTGRSTIKCGSYATFGSYELSENVINALGNGWACLMANHGLVACGRSVEHAVSVAEEVEELCKQYMIALSTGLEIKMLSKEQMDEVLMKFSSYGQWAEKN